MKDKGRPDFIGISHGAYHVFEAKGRSLQASSSSRSSTIAARCMTDALAQVSRIDTVGGVQPKTRTAAVWVLRPGGLRGFVTDPPAGRAGYDLTFDLAAALLKHYRIVLDLDDTRDGQRGGERRLVRLRLSGTRTLMVEPKLLDILRNLQNRLVSAEDVLGFLEGRSRAYRRLRRFAEGRVDIAFGLNGIGLLGNNDDGPRRKPMDERPVEV